MHIRQTTIAVLPVASLVPNEGQLEEYGVHENPRFITEDDFAKLKASISEDDLTGLNPIKVFEYKGQYIVIGGNMRVRALRELGIEDVSCIIIPPTTDAATLEKEIITDNANFGQWQFDKLANWDTDKLNKWGAPAKWDKPEDFGEEFNLPEGERQPFQQITFILANEQAEIVKQAVEEAKGLEEYKHQDSYGNTNSNGNAIAIIVQQWAEQRK